MAEPGSDGYHGSMTFPTGRIERRQLGLTSVSVCALGFGAMELRGPNHRLPRVLETGQQVAVLNAVLDAGIDLIDTSIDYGESEEWIGRAVGHRRDEYFLASKVGCPVDSSELHQINPSSPLPHDFGRQNIRAGVAQSLKRLKTECLDLIQLHISPSLEILQRDDVVATLLELVSEGKARFIGASSTLPNIADLLKIDAFDCFQVPYSLLNREHEQIMMDIAAAGAGVIVRGGISRGRPERVHPNMPNPWETWDVANLDDLLEPGQNRAAFMLRFTMSRVSVGSVIVGTGSVENLGANVEAARLGPLAPDIVLEATSRTERAESILADRLAGLVADDGTGRSSALH
jgi:aryl-alcohol dehydrogenase-like predicted oxidoreductase